MAASLSGMTLPSWASHLMHRLAPPPLLLVQAYVNTLDLDLHSDMLVHADEARVWLGDVGLRDPGQPDLAADLELAGRRRTTDGMRCPRRQDPWCPPAAARPPGEAADTPLPLPEDRTTAVIHRCHDRGCHTAVGTGVLCAARSRANRQEPAMSESGRMGSATEGFVAHRNLLFTVAYEMLGRRRGGRPAGDLAPVVGAGPGASVLGRIGAAVS